jgi:hypothetical protein
MYKTGELFRQSFLENSLVLVAQVLLYQFMDFLLAEESKDL